MIEHDKISDVLRRVQVYLSVARYEAAERLLKSTLAEHPDFANLVNLLGVTCHRQSRFVEAIQHFTRALKLNPQFIEAGLNLAATLCDLSRYGEAQKIYEEMQKNIPSSHKHADLILGRLANQHANLGELYAESGLPTEAVHEYQKALNLKPQLTKIRLAMARVFGKLGQVERATRELEECCRHDQDLPVARLWLGIFYYKAGKKDAARSQWDMAFRADPSLSSARSYLRLSQGKSPAKLNF